MCKRILTLIFCCIVTIVRSQGVVVDSLFVLPSSVKPFTIENFYLLILDNHPIVKQSELLSEMAKQEIRLARGHFDPKLESSFLLKHYNNTEYYRLFDGSLKFPTQSPVSPVIGIERNKGKYVNPENYISDTYNYQQLYAGFAIPLGQGLITDERRNALNQAKLFTDLMEAEQVKMINKILLEAAKEYWQWYFSYYNLRLAEQTAGIAEEIFRRTKMNFSGGELAPIDTVQSKITYLERIINRQEAMNDFRNSTIRISNFLWDSLGNPLVLPGDFVPVSTEQNLMAFNIDELREMAKANHPELIKQNVKLEQLEFDRQLARELMKPRLDLNYYLLNQPFNPEGMSNSLEFNDNYKFGVDFSIPILLRKERAKLALTKLKINNASFERDMTRRQIVNDIDVAYNNLQNMSTIVSQQQAMVANYSRLMQAELLNLENGESDLFKINIQQEKLFNAQSKLIKTLAEFEKQKAVLYWAAGTRPLVSGN